MKARRVFYLSLLLIVATAASYASSFEGKFVLDDIGRIVESSIIRSIPFAAKQFSTRYLVDLTFAFDYARGGLNPSYYHFTNLLIHLMCGLFLLLLSRKLMLISDKTEKCADWSAFFIALIWSVHPLATSAVTYICQRYESMMSLMLLLAMFCLALARGVSGRKYHLLLFLSALTCLGGMLCKQVMIVAPFLLFVMDVSFISGTPFKALRDRWGYYLIVGSGATMLLFSMTLGEGSIGPMFSSYASGHGVVMNLMNQSVVLLHYLTLSFWPHPLTVDLAWLPVLNVSHLLLPTGIVAALFVLTSYGVVRWSRAFFAGALVFIILAPTSSFIPVPDLAVEHRMYLPLAGLVASLVLAAAHLVARWPKARVFVCVIGAAAAIALGHATFQRNSDYADAEKFWGDVVERIPHNFRAWSFFTNAKLSHGKFAEAEISSRRMLAGVKQVKGLNNDGRYDIPSSSPKMYEAMGRVALGTALLAQGKATEALKLFSMVVNEHPEDRAARHNRALALLALGYRAEAEAELHEVLRVYVGSMESSMVMAQLLTESGRHAEAAQSLKSTLKTYPGFIPARVELAWLLASTDDDELRDTELAGRLVDGIEGEMGMTSIRLMDVRASILAANGDSEAAAKIQTQAVADAEEHHPGSAYNTELKERLALYREGEVFRLRSGSGPEKE